ncbi:MAG: hypothetical protein R2755_28545 [Acidimicrobiales bacterium]
MTDRSDGRHYPPDARYLLATTTCRCGATFSAYTFGAATLGSGADAYTSYVPEPRVECPACLRTMQPDSLAPDWTDRLRIIDRRLDPGSGGTSGLN